MHEKTKLPALRCSQKRDMRHAGIFNEGHDILNPPVKTKFQTLVEDFKSTTYKSYWARAVGKAPDQIPSLPEDFKTYDTVLGKAYAAHENLYEIIMPNDSTPDKTSGSKKIAHQINRNYCLFNPLATFGNKTDADPSGKLMKCCLRDDRISEGTSLKRPILEKQAEYQFSTVARLGLAQTPNENINCVPEGYTFGILCHPDNLAECLRTCVINPYKDEIKKCLVHLNTLRKCLAKRYDRNFYRKFYLSLKILDKSQSGWLCKQIVYKQCSDKYIRFNQFLIEPLLSIWHAFDGFQIEYKTFIHVINHYEPSPEMPKIQDMECIDYRTIYSDSFKDCFSYDTNGPMAGTPSGKYFDKEYPVTPDGCCKADRIYLPEESDAKACLNPSIFTSLGVSHRDMYAKRDPKHVRKVFENAGETFEDNQFETIWEIAQKYHSRGWVCFETFRRSIVEYKRTKV
nr:EF-hand domain-containing family member B-like [Maniola hyperantus]